MADPKFPYVKWRDGRPRSSHGAYARALGFVDTDLTRGMPGLFWLISPDQAAAKILAAARRGSATAYVPARWRLVGLVIRSIPSFLFRRLKI